MQVQVTKSLSLQAKVRTPAPRLLGHSAEHSTSHEPDPDKAEGLCGGTQKECGCGQQQAHGRVPCEPA
jgi:hypothetical protein